MDIVVSVAATLTTNQGTQATERGKWFAAHQEALQEALSKALTAATHTMPHDPSAVLGAISKELADLAEQKKAELAPTITSMDEETLRSAFNAFDTDGDGTLDPTEAIAILTRPGTGLALSLADAEALIAEFDSDGDGKMSVAEFIAQAKYAAAAGATSPFLDAVIAFYSAACEVDSRSDSGRFEAICEAFLQAEKEAIAGEDAAFRANFVAAMVEDSSPEAMVEAAAALYGCLCKSVGTSTAALSTHARTSLDQLAATTVEAFKATYEDIEEKLDVETFKVEFIGHMRATCKELGIDLGYESDMHA